MELLLSVLAAAAVETIAAFALAAKGEAVLAVKLERLVQPQAQSIQAVVVAVAALKQTEQQAVLASSSFVMPTHTLLQRLPRGHQLLPCLEGTAFTSGQAPARLLFEEQAWRTLHNSMRTTSSLR